MAQPSEIIWNDLFFIRNINNYGFGVGVGVAVPSGGVPVTVGVSVPVGAGVLVDGIEGVGVITPARV